MSPKTNEQFAAMRRESQQKIEAAALQLFAQRGFHNTSILAIARAAGVSKGLLYNYYQSKEDLLNSLIGHAIDEHTPQMEQLLESAASPFTKIKAIIEASLSMVQANRHYWKLLTTLALQADVMQQVQHNLQHSKHVMMEAIIALFAQMGYAAPEQEARLFGASLDGLMLHYLSSDGSYPLASMQHYLIQKYQP